MIIFRRRIFAALLIVALIFLSSNSTASASKKFQGKSFEDGKTAALVDASHPISGKNFWFEVIELPLATGDQAQLQQLAYTEFSQNHIGKKSFPFEQRFYWHLDTGSKMVLCVWGRVDNPQETLGWATFDRQGESQPHGPTWRVSWGGDTRVLSAPGHWRTNKGHPPIATYVPGEHRLDDSEKAILAIGKGKKGRFTLLNPKNKVESDREYFCISFGK